ncbi:MAG: hypothetical protein ACYC1E_00570 [Propionibacteriaceae bacterium]
MLDGFQYVLGQISVVLVITALLAAVLGWYLGRGSRRRNDAALERALAAITRGETDASPFAPSQAADREDPADEVPETTDRGGEPEFPTHRLPFGMAPIDHVPLHEGDDAEGTVIRPAPDETVLRPSDATVLRPSVQVGTAIPPSQDGTVIRGVQDVTLMRHPEQTTVLRPGQQGTVIRPTATPFVPSTVIRSVPGISERPVDADAPSTVEDGSLLRPDLRDADLQVGRIEAAALAAWDRTVPMLEQQLQDLAAQNDELHLMLRDAQDRLESGATTHLRAVAVESRNAERRARA